MGRYMTVVLKDDYKREDFINQINLELSEQYGANSGIKFNTWQYLQEEADYINNTDEGKKQLPHFERPITKEVLHISFFWFRFGEFSFKLSGDNTSDEARDAVAVCKWISYTKGKYIDKIRSYNYDKATVQQYLNHLFIEDGYDPEKLWKLPK